MAYAALQTDLFLIFFLANHNQKNLIFHNLNIFHPSFDCDSCLFLFFLLIFFLELFKHILPEIMLKNSSDVPNLKQNKNVWRNIYFFNENVQLLGLKELGIYRKL